jgi:hypothetical protein
MANLSVRTPGMIEDDPISEKEAEKAAIGCGLVCVFVAVLASFVSTMLGGC